MTRTNVSILAPHRELSRRSREAAHDHENACALGLLGVSPVMRARHR